MINARIYSLLHCVLLTLNLDVIVLLVSVKEKMDVVLLNFSLQLEAIDTK